VRTLVVSDLHLGSRLERDVLRRPAAFAALRGALDGIDRLVLLGDVVELLEGRPRVALELARPVLQELGAAMGAGREIVVVAGNHDHALVRPWLRARIAAGRPIGLAARVPAASSAALERLTGWLRPARVRVAYPGTWAGRGVWATHGHYLDRHLYPEERRGAALLGVVPAGRATAEDYEAASGPSMAALQGLLAMSLPSVVGEPLDVVAGLTRRVAFAALPLATSLPGAARLAPLSAGVMGFQFRRNGLPAMAEVVARLHPRARHVIFGHLHRGGPLAADDPREWRPDARRALHNSGSWVYEPLLLAGASPGHPYWPGGAVLVEDGRAPRFTGLLAGVDARALR
jgi:calcineurin-like phosphoesterase family protein